MKWIPVSERLPERLEKVLAYLPVTIGGEPYIETGYLHDHNTDWEIGEQPYCFDAVTHWAKLEGPKQKKP